MPIYDQPVNLIRFALSFTILYIVLAAVLFPRREGESLLEIFFTRFCKMVLLTIAAGYLLVAVKLYEFLSIFGVFVFFFVLWTVGRGKGFSYLGEIGAQVMVVVYKLLDREIILEQWFAERMRRSLQNIKKGIRTLVLNPGYLLLIFTVLGSAYLRFWDSLQHAAPSMSDAYVTLAWMKYMEENILFHDGIYPQGFHIYLATLKKFAGHDALYTLKYAGPLNGVLITLGIFLFVRGLTRSIYSGVGAAFIFGIFGHIIPVEFARQASTNSQEFALIFLAPAWYYTLSYLETKKTGNLVTALAAYTVTGLVHTLIFAFMAWGVSCFLVVYLLTGFKKNLKAFGLIAGAGILSGLFSVIPLAFGLLMGREFHSSSVEYLTSNLHSVIPDLSLPDYGVLAAVGISVTALFLSREVRSRYRIVLGVGFLTILSFCLYLYAGPLTGNAVLVSRIGILWAVVICISLGLGWWALFRTIPLRPRRIIEPVLCLAVLVMGVYIFKPTPPHPYKMQYDSLVNQYVRINKEITPTTWMVVSSMDGYALVLGRGWHMHLGDFLDTYSPNTPKITQIDDPGKILNTEHIFLMREKEMLRPDFENLKPILEEREYNYGRMKEWVEKYTEKHDNLRVYYEDEKIIVHHIHQPVEKNKKPFGEIWDEFR